MTDSERLDAIGEHGLCIATHESLKNSEWEQTWVCTYYIGTEQRVVFSPDIRSVIDTAVLDLDTSSSIEH